MATNRLFTFNNGPSIGDALQYGNLSVSTSAIDGHRWWPGPDEDLGYVIAHDDTNPNMRTEGARSATVSTNSIGFWRSAKTNTDFLTMVNGLFNQNFVDGTTAKDWLLTNGYWTSYDVDSLGRFGITSGLILYIDAGNTASYPGTGSTWYDLSGQGHDGLLFAGGTASLPSFNSEYGGSIVFDGISNGCNFVPFIGNYPTPGGVFYETGISNNLQTFCSWIYGTSSSDGVTEPLENPNQVNGGYNSFFGSNTSSAGMFQLPLFYTSDGQLQLGVSFYGYGANVEPNIIVSVSASTWNYACVVKTAPSIFDVYFNGDKVITGATRSAYNSNIWDAGYNGLNVLAGGTYSNNGITYSVSSSASSEFALGGWNATQRQPSRVRSVQIYNRALSEQEIIENYNTQKTGFGLSELGTLANPASSAQALYDAGQTTDGWYYIQTSNMASSRQIYCNMTDEGGGWMLMTYNPDLNTNYGNPYPNEWIGGEGSFDVITSNTIVAIGATSNPPNYPTSVNPPRTYSGKWTSIDVRDVWYNNGVAQCSKVMRMASTSDNKIPVLSNMDVANKIIYSNPNNLKISATFSYKYVYDPILNATIWMTAKDGSTITLSGNNTVSMVGTWSSIIGYTILTNDIPITAPGDWMISVNSQWNIVDSINPPSAVDQTQDIGGLTWNVPSPSNPGPYHMVSGQIVNDAQTFGLSDVGIGVDSERLDLRTLAIYIK